ncbi:DUF2256 domain-containing protein [Burkholderia sp. LA-2-3-30-S1-D2]|uniref:DUF2256 domain-containing protein n=1 Tax=Burkholderia sp. LA-2-3-30-S1-D2 TaxID=1637862 RepID=UPI0009E78968|nr:DUF2256 domain-containing protein [Burkholderia sp. LA-2-3-30-S1-D2]
MANKTHLPDKICETCVLPFSWRKKWKAVWGEVRYCSERCRRNRRSPSGMKTNASGR